MQDFRQDFKRFRQPRAGPIEESVAVNQKDLSAADGAQAAPLRSGFKQRRILPGALDIEAAQGEHDRVRVGSGQFLEIEQGRVLAGLA